MVGWMAGWPTVIIMLLSLAGAWAWAELGNTGPMGFSLNCLKAVNTCEDNDYSNLLVCLGLYLYID